MTGSCDHGDDDDAAGEDDDENDDGGDGDVLPKAIFRKTYKVITPKFCSSYIMMIDQHDLSKQIFCCVARCG